jgi:hypothetical protein
MFEVLIEYAAPNGTASLPAVLKPLRSSVVTTPADHPESAFVVGDVGPLVQHMSFDLLPSLSGAMTWRFQRLGFKLACLDDHDAPLGDLQAYSP